MKSLFKIIAATAAISLLSTTSLASATPTTDVNATVDPAATAPTDTSTAVAAAETQVDATQAQLGIVSATARPSMDGSSNSAAYITLHNNAATDITITGATSLDIANNVELHTIADEQGVKKMVKVDKLVIPAGGDLVMQKGGVHIMLMDLKKNLAVGDKFDIDIITQELGAQKVTVEVVQM